MTTSGVLNVSMSLLFAAAMMYADVQSEPPPATLDPAPPGVLLELESMLGEGSLTVNDRAFADHNVSLTASETVIISARSPDFDPVVEIRRQGSEELLGVDDDGGEGYNSRLVYTPTEDGAYVVRVLTFGTGRGAYGVRVARRPPMPALTTAGAGEQTISWGEAFGLLTVSLSADDSSAEYAVLMLRGDEMIIGAEADAFDPMLEVVSSDEMVIASDDNNGGGSNSLLAFKVPASGRYIVRVRSFGGEPGTFPYRIRLGRLASSEDGTTSLTDDSSVEPRQEFR